MATKSCSLHIPLLLPWGFGDMGLPCYCSLPAPCSWETWQAGRSFGSQAAQLPCSPSVQASLPGSLRGHLLRQSGNLGSPGERFGFERKCSRGNWHVVSRRMNFQHVAGSVSFCVRTSLACRQSASLCEFSDSASGLAHRCRTVHGL